MEEPDLAAAMVLTSAERMFVILHRVGSLASQAPRSLGKKTESLVSKIATNKPHMHQNPSSITGEESVASQEY